MEPVKTENIKKGKYSEKRRKTNLEKRAVEFRLLRKDKWNGK